MLRNGLKGGVHDLESSICEFDSSFAADPKIDHKPEPILDNNSGYTTNYAQKFKAPSI